MQHPYGLAVFGDYVFWTDWVHHAVGRAEKRRGRQAKFIIREGMGQPMGIVAVSREALKCEYDDGWIVGGRCYRLHRVADTAACPIEIPDLPGAVECPKQDLWSILCNGRGEC